jgi:hypothetical protein
MFAKTAFSSSLLRSLKHAARVRQVKQKQKFEFVTVVKISMWCSVSFMLLPLQRKDVVFSETLVSI